MVLYIWLGTCDITERTSRLKGYIETRYKTVGNATDRILAQYNRLKVSFSKYKEQSNSFVYLLILYQHIIKGEDIDILKKFLIRTPLSNRMFNY